MDTQKRGLLLVMSGPSGVGKGTVCKKLVAEIDNLVCPISATTRERRNNEIDGKTYYYLSEEEFLQRREKGELLEWAEVYGNYYGTLKSIVEENLRLGKDIILEIDPQGAFKVKEKYPEAILIFLLPPSIEELKKRILLRAREAENVIEERLAKVEPELKKIQDYEYMVYNDVLNDTINKIQSIIDAEKCRVGRNLKTGEVIL